MTNSIFAGREKELSILDNVNKKLQLGKPIPIYTFFGRIGLGKTTLLNKIIEQSSSVFPGYFINSIFMPKTPIEFIHRICLEITKNFGAEFPRTGMILARIKLMIELNEFEIDGTFNFRNNTLARDEDDIYPQVKYFFKELFGKDFYQLFLGLELRELIGILPIAFGKDIDSMISDNSLRGFILAIDDIDDLKLLPCSWLLKIKQQSHRILLLFTSENPIEHQKIENIQARSFTKSDFFTFLRKKGINIEPVSQDIDFESAMLRVPFWTNLFAENLLKNIFPKDGQVISYDTIGENFWQQLPIQYKNLLGLLFIIPKYKISRLDTIIDDFDINVIDNVIVKHRNEIALSKSFVGFIGKKLREESEIRSFIKQIANSNIFDNPALDAINDKDTAIYNLISDILVDIYLVKTDNADKIANNLDNMLRIFPMVPFWEYLLHRYREIYFDSELLHENQKIEKKNQDGIYHFLNLGISQINIYLDLGEFRAAKDELDEMAEYLGNISSSTLSGMNRRFLRCLLTYSAISIYRNLGATEKMLAEYDSLKLYWHRLSEVLPRSLQDIILILEIHTDLEKLKDLIILRSEGLMDGFANINRKLQKLRKGKMHSYLEWSINYQKSIFLSSHQSTLRALSTIQLSRKQIIQFLKNIEISDRKKTLLLVKYGTDFADMISALSDANAFNKYINDVIKSLKSIKESILENDPELLFTLGRAYFVSGNFLFYQNKYVESYSQLSLATGLYQRYLDFRKDDRKIESFLSDAYYLCGRASEKLRNYKNAQELFKLAEDYTRMLLKRKENEEFLLTRLGMIIFRKSRAYEILGFESKSRDSLEKGIRIYELLLKSGASEPQRVLFNLGQAQLFKATTVKMSNREALDVLEKSLENLEKSARLGFEKSSSLIEHIGSVALSIYNNAIDGNDYNDAFKATLLAGKTALLTDHTKLKNNTIELILQWEQFPLNQEYYQMLKDLEINLKD
ncbi:MAG: hypothetical protein ACLFSQ_03310 [Candidatus Zixiibacteriota bacterium]